MRSQSVCFKKLDKWCGGYVVGNSWSDNPNQIKTTRWPRGPKQQYTSCWCVFFCRTWIDFSHQSFFRWWICIYISIVLSLYNYIFMYIYIYMIIYTYIYIYILFYMYFDTYIYIYIHIHLCYIYIYMCVSILTSIYLHIYLYVHEYIHLYLLTFIDIDRIKWNPSSSGDR